MFGELARAGKGGLRMVQPENGIEGGIGDIGHVTAISNQGVDDVVHVLYAVIRISVFIDIGSVGEG